MSLDTQFNTTDTRFVEAALDADKRQRRIERLSRTRRHMYIILGIQGLLLFISIFLNIIQQATTRTSLPSDVSSITVWVMSAVVYAYWLYTDLQIKFLKASASLGSTSGIGLGAA